MQQRLGPVLAASPIIAAVRDPRHLSLALQSPAAAVFLLTGSLLNVADLVRRVVARSKLAFVHLDLVEGLAKDQTGLKWLARTAEPAGIITTRSALITPARNLGLATVQRIFLIDSQSLATGIDAARSARPDVVEVLPAIMHEVTATVAERVGCPVIAGGLARTVQQARAALAAGAVAVSTSEIELWGMGGGLNLIGR